MCNKKQQYITLEENIERKNKMKSITMWNYIRRKRKKTINEIAIATGVSRPTIYLFEEGKCQNIKLMAYYLRLNGREIDKQLADILDNDYEEFYAKLRSDRND